MQLEKRKYRYIVEDNFMINYNYLQLERKKNVSIN